MGNLGTYISIDHLVDRVGTYHSGERMLQDQPTTRRSQFMKFMKKPATIVSVEK